MLLESFAYGVVAVTATGQLLGAPQSEVGVIDVSEFDETSAGLVSGLVKAALFKQFFFKSALLWLRRARMSSPSLKASLELKGFSGFLAAFIASLLK